MALPNKIRSLQVSVNQLLNWFLDDRSLILDIEGAHRPAEIAKHIVAAYSIVNDIHGHNNATSIKNLKSFDPAAYKNENDKDYVKNIFDIFEFVNLHLSHFLNNFILHGSLATVDYSKGWSDVDTFVIINNDTMMNFEKLIALREKCLNLKNVFYKICPLQHHGLIVFTEADLRAYQMNYIPIEALEDACEFLASAQSLVVSLDNRKEDENIFTTTRLEAIKRIAKIGWESDWFCHHPYNGECLKGGYRNDSNAMRQLFWLLGNVMTMPAYLMTGIGQPCSKKNSFLRASAYYSTDSSKFIESATLIRKTWSENEYLNYKGNAIPNWIKGILENEYLKNFYLLISETLEIIYTQRHHKL